MQFNIFSSLGKRKPNGELKPATMSISLSYNGGSAQKGFAIVSDGEGRILQCKLPHKALVELKEFLNNEFKG